MSARVYLLPLSIFEIILLKHLMDWAYSPFIMYIYHSLLISICLKTVLYLNRIFHTFLVGVCFFMPPSVLRATHIVGGDMTYRFIEQVGESNRYMFRLNIYYDCRVSTNDCFS